MSHQVTIAGLVEWLRDLCENHSSSTTVLVDDSGGWGKVAMRDGDIFSVRYGRLSGTAALERLSRLERVRYHVRFEVEPTGHRDITTNEFFASFGIDITPSATRTEAQPSPPPPAEPRPTRHGHKILIADDSTVARKSIARILLENGYRVVEAKSGFEALGQLANEAPDLVLLDVVMPGMDGYKVLEAIKKNEQYKGLPVFILTSRDRLLDRLKGLLSDSDLYFTKPVDAERLLEQIAHHLQQHQQS